MFRESITHAGGVTEGTASEAHAMLTLRRAVRRGYAVEATPTGGAVITWTARHFGVGTQVIEEARQITFTPHVPVGKLTDPMRQDLAGIASTRRTAYGMENGRRVIVGGFWRIPPVTTARIRVRGLVVEEAGRVRLSLTARLALLADAHRTSTTAPAGWHRPADPSLSAGLNRPGGRAGMLHSAASQAVCSCGALAAVGDDRAEARRLATAHRRDAARAFVLAELEPAAA